MKHRILRRRRDGVKQHYIVGRKLKRNFGAWNDDVDGGDLFRSPSKKYKITKTYIPAEKIIDVEKKSNQTREEWVEKIRNSSSDTYAYGPDEKKTRNKDGTYDLETLKQSILSNEKKVPAVTIDKTEGKQKLWEGRHRVASAYLGGQPVRAVILEKKSQKELDKEDKRK